MAFPTRSRRACAVQCLPFRSVVAGHFHQGDATRFVEPRNSQCVANSACAVAFATTGAPFSPSVIDDILISGDAVYRQVRRAHPFLFPDELPRDFLVRGQCFYIAEQHDEYDELFPQYEDDRETVVVTLGQELERIIASAPPNSGYLFTGQNNTAAFWVRNGAFFLFDPHGVNDQRRHDLHNDKNNVARLFKCDNVFALSRLLLINSAVDGTQRQFNVNRLTFRTGSSNVQQQTGTALAAQVSCLQTRRVVPRCSNGLTEVPLVKSRASDPKLHSMYPVVRLKRMTLDEMGPATPVQRPVPFTGVSPRAEDVNHMPGSSAVLSLPIDSKLQRKTTVVHREQIPLPTSDAKRARVQGKRPHVANVPPRRSQRCRNTLRPADPKLDSLTPVVQLQRLLPREVCPKEPVQRVSLRRDPFITTPLVDPKLQLLQPVVQLQRMETDYLSRGTLSKQNRGNCTGSHTLQSSTEKLFIDQPAENRRRSLDPVIEPSESSDVTSKVGQHDRLRGRPKKRKRGRPKTSHLSRQDQQRAAARRYHEKHPESLKRAVQRHAEAHPEPHREAVQRYSQQHPEVNREAVQRYNQQHPEVHREAVQRYNQQHPEVNREAVQRYNQQHPEVNREAVQRYTLEHPEVNRAAVVRYSDTHSEERREAVRRFRVQNPKLTDLRHLRANLARVIVAHGPMGYWQGELLNNIELYKLKQIDLWSTDTYTCPSCNAPLFEEEKDRKQWCCGSGRFNVMKFEPLTANFYDLRRFLDRARAYNDLFAFCSMRITGGYRHPPRGLSFLKIEGRVYHQVQPVYPVNASDAVGQSSRDQPNFSRLYIDDGHERSQLAQGRNLDLALVDTIQKFIEAKNPYARELKRMGQLQSESARLDFEVTRRATHGNTLGDQNRGLEVHAVLNTTEAISENTKLSIWYKSDSRPVTIDYLSPLMEPLQYPLLFPEGTAGWHRGLLDNNGKQLTLFNYARCLLLSERRFATLGRLSQAWQLETFVRYEEMKLRYLKWAQQGGCVQGQRRLGPLNELLAALPAADHPQAASSSTSQLPSAQPLPVPPPQLAPRQAAASRQPDGVQVQTDITRDETIQGEGGAQPGKIYLPSSFTGGPRYMKVHYENAMGIVSREGAPDLFITFTYSGNWCENKKSCPTGKSDSSTSCRIFQLKKQELLRDLRSGALFGRPAYIIWIIEMQMRGWPHIHIAVKFIGGPHFNQATQVDSVVRADIPLETEAGGRLRELVLKHMIHGPCGPTHSTDFTCWDRDKGYCTKYFPKPQVETTYTDDRGFVHYRRDWANVGYVRTRTRDILVHDGWVVPYNAALLLKYESHINVEIAENRRIIAYLFKYLMKGGSLQNVTVVPLRQQQDEIEHYTTKRMVGASDACWRLLDFDISASEPTVECLPVHLEGQQTVFFKPGQLAEAVAASRSRLLIYFERPLDETFDDVTYLSFYENYIIHTARPRSGQYWECQDGLHFVTRRQRGRKVCRLFWVSPTQGEKFYLRILLLKYPCRGYADLISRGPASCSTFQEVARHLGLVDDLLEYEQALEEATSFMVGRRLRNFFVLLCNIGAPALVLWTRFKTQLCADLLERHDAERAERLAKIEVDRILRRHGSCAEDHGLGNVDDDTTELGREMLEYGQEHQRQYVSTWQPLLSADQQRVFDHINSLLQQDPPRTLSKVLFLDGPGGYGKTQLIRVILSHVRSLSMIALATASSGIAAGNMDGGTTAHSMFKLPLDLGKGVGTWNITNGSQRAELIRAARLIVFDEAPMAHRHAIEMIDRSLRDLTNVNQPFGGKIFLCSGDFRQIAPVVEKAKTPLDVISVSLRSSHLWPLFTVFHLTTPQRTAESDYSRFLLRLGEGSLPEITIGTGRERETLVALEGIRFVDHVDHLVADVFPHNILRNPEECATRAILATLNVNVREINDRILDLLEGDVYSLLSADSVHTDEEGSSFDVDQQLLNESKAKGVPNHILRLKINSVCLITRNLHFGDGLHNGTKVIVTNISRRIVTVRKPGSQEVHCIPRINFVFPLFDASPVKVCRRQFPLQLAYTMSGHKSQGQTIEKVGIDLRTDVFTHGQLYVLLSRNRSPEDIVVLVPPERIINGRPYVKNIVWKDLLL